MARGEGRGAGGRGGEGRKVGKPDAVEVDASPPLYSGDLAVFPATDFDTAGQITIVQSEPLPLDILAIMHKLTVSEG